MLSASGSVSLLISVSVFSEVFNGFLGFVGTGFVIGFSMIMLLFRTTPKARLGLGLKISRKNIRILKIEKNFRILD